MDGLARMVGAGCGFPLGGATWLMEPLRVRHWGEIEHYLLYSRPSNPLPGLAAALRKVETEELGQKLIRKTADGLRADKLLRIVTSDEAIGWISSDPEGLTYSAWCCFRDCGNPDFRTLEGVAVALGELDAEGIANFLRLRDQISGIDLIANADWPDPFALIPEHRREKRASLMRQMYAQWRKNFYILADSKRFTPEAIGEMTLYTLHTYCSKPEDLGIEVPKTE